MGLQKIGDTMQVANLIGLSQVVVATEALPPVLANEVLIKVEAVGICGSDIHYYQHGHIGTRTVQYPHIQGHEFAGTVVDVGAQVTKFAVGDRVTVEPGIPCRTCEKCRSGKYHLCDAVLFLSTPPHKGALRQYVSHPEDFVFSIPNELSFEEATFAEPLSVAIHALRRANLQPGMKVLITGMGPVGLMCVCAANYYNANEIFVTDMVEQKLNVAIGLGATHTVKIPNEAIKENYFEIVIETSGANQAIQSGIRALKKGGKLVAIGFPKAEVSLDLTRMLQREIDLMTVYRYANTFPLAISILKELGGAVQALITSTFELKDIDEAMKKATETQTGSIKVIVYPNKKREVVTE